MWTPSSPPPELTLALTATPTKDNSPVIEMAYSVESSEEGVFSIPTNTRYNAEGQFSYNHLGQAVQVTDGSSTRTCGYNNCSKAESCPYTQHLETLSLKARAEYGKERVSMKKLLSIASILTALAGTASAAPYYLPSPQYGALTPYDMQPVYAIDAIYAVGDGEMLDTWGVRGSFNLYNDAEGTFRHQFNVGVGYECGEDKIDSINTEIYLIPVTAGYDLNIELTDGILLTIGGKAGYSMGKIKDDEGYSDNIDGFTFRVGGGLKVQCSEAVYIRAGYEFGRTFTDDDNFGQHIISVGVGCQF